MLVQDKPIYLDEYRPPVERKRRSYLDNTKPASPLPRHEDRIWKTGHDVVKLVAEYLDSP